jgi:2-polyprenyl-3-methyl-5-hydroxy-6-metoxy-1,4-benzoquinol methylase
LTRTSHGVDTKTLQERVDLVNRTGGAYHKFDLGQGVIVDGDYDLSKYIHHYAIPRPLTGMTVLDVGTSAGYLAIECARRGAEVTAIDLWETCESLQIASAAFGVSVRYLQRDLFALDESFGQFDLVICGSMLLHLASPLDAIRKIRGWDRLSKCVPSPERRLNASLRTLVSRGHALPMNWLWITVSHGVNRGPPLLPLTRRCVLRASWTSS